MLQCSKYVGVVSFLGKDTAGPAVSGDNLQQGVEACTGVTT
jgi:hypothetical protein